VKRAILAAALLLSGAFSAQVDAQQADCLLTGNAKLPSKVTFDDGSTVAVIERSGDTLRLETTLPDGRKSAGSSYRGLFLLTRELPTGGTFEFRWNRDLAQFFPLRVGEQIVAEAMVSLSPNRGTGSYDAEMSVVAEETIRIGNCDYPVFKIEVPRRLSDGTLSGKGVQYYHAASMLTLKSLNPTPATETMPAKTVERRAIRVE
jgi:hypothetical protein